MPVALFADCISYRSCGCSFNTPCTTTQIRPDPNSTIAILNGAAATSARARGHGVHIELGRAPTRGLARVQRWRLPSPSGGYGWTREATTISPRWGRGGVACGRYSVWDSGHRCNIFSAICVLKGAVADATTSSLTGWGPGGSCLSSLYRSRFT